MELCEDLIERVQLYGISAYLDENSILDKLNRNWEVRENEDLTVETTLIKANGFFSSLVAYVFE
jgi:hypothetical protein